MSNHSTSLMPSIEKNIPETVLAYSPNALLNAIGNSLTSPLLNQVFKIKGIYRPGKGVNYNGSYYDIIRDEFNEANLVLVTPERLRSQLRDGQLIEASVYLSKRFQAATGRIDLLLTLNELFSKEEKVVSEAETKAFTLIQQKVKTGYKDADSFIKKRLYEQKPIRVNILVGLGAIIDNDIKHQIREAAVAYQFNYIRVNLSQVVEISKALIANDGADILVIARGGGENMAIFDNPGIAETALQLRSILITALGHSTDDPLLQKVADRAFITPTALGQYFHDLYNKTIDDFNDSKTKLIGDLTRQIDLNYQNKLQDLNSRLAESTRSNQEATRSNQEATRNAELQLRYLSERLVKTKSTNSVLYGVLLVLIGIVLYFLLKKGL